MYITHFTDARIQEIQAGTLPMTAEERDYLIESTPRFEECGFKREELAAMNDADLMQAAYDIWAEVANGMH